MSLRPTDQAASEDEGRPAAGPGRRRARWPWLLAGAGALGLLLAQVLSGGSPAVENRAAAYLLAAAELPDAATARHLRSSPPVDLDAAERLARASFGQIPVPAAREMITWRRASSGHEITQVVLLYEDPSQAARLDELAVAMLPGTLGLQPQPLDLPGAQDARLWRAENYQAATFRLGGVAVLVGTTDLGDPAGARRLAAAALRRASLASTAAAATGGVAPTVMTPSGAP